MVSPDMLALCLLLALLADLYVTTSIRWKVKSDLSDLPKVTQKETMDRDLHLGKGTPGPLL